MPLIVVCSPSTEKFIKGADRYIVVTAPPNKKLEPQYNNVVAIGGGSVIDYAKMITKKKLTVYPTTASGACLTSHAVVWGEKKESVKTILPTKVIVKKEYLVDVPAAILRNTFFDATAHCLDSLNSTKRTTLSKKKAIEGLELLIKYMKTGDCVSLIEGGNKGGEAIEITGTNLLHALSYPLSLRGVPHGLALGWIMKKASIIKTPMSVPRIPWGKIINEALQYPKIHETTLFKPTRENLYEMLK